MSARKTTKLMLFGSTAAITQVAISQRIKLIARKFRSHLVAVQMVLTSDIVHAKGIVRG